MTFEGRKIEAAIFDMDGTMFDTERLRFDMLKQASAKLVGESISDALLMASLGLSAVSAEALAKKTYGQSYPYRAVRAKADELETAYVRANGVPVKEGLYDVLERLKRSGVLIALATSSRRAIAEEYLVGAHVMRYFDILVCGDEVQKGKPDPEIFLKAARALNCDASACLIFEDSQSGLLAASSAGGLPIYVKDIKDPAPDVKAKAFRAYERMTDFLQALIPCTPKLPMPKINEQFPQNAGYARVGIHGFGSIGGGYLAQVFSHWDGYTRPAELIAATPNRMIRELVNAFGRYAVKYESLAYFQTITGVRVIDMDDEDAMADMYTRAQIVGLALPEQAIRTQAPLIAKCLLRRFERTDEPLTLLVVLNKIKGGVFVRRHIENALCKLVEPKRAHDVLRKVVVSETVVNRMVGTLPPDELATQVQGKLLRLQRRIAPLEADALQVLYFSAAAHRTKRPSRYTEAETVHIDKMSRTLHSLAEYGRAVAETNITLFSSEPDMPLYASKGSPILETLRQVVVVDDIGLLQDIKNKLSNGTHAIIAWYAALLGYQTIGQGMGDERVLELATRVMRSEVGPALLAERPELGDYIASFISNFIKRCRLSFKDSCHRVGRDPMRKLQSGERVFGAIALARKNGIETSGLEFGAACALLYAVLLLNPKDKESQRIRELYAKNHSVADVLTYTGSYNGAPYRGLDPEADRELITRVAEHFDALAAEFSGRSDTVAV